MEAGPFVEARCSRFRLCSVSSSNGERRCRDAGIRGQLRTSALNFRQKKKESKNFFLWNLLGITSVNECDLHSGLTEREKVRILW